MTIFVTCDCGKTYQLSDDKAGKRGTCQECGSSLQIPSAGSVPDAPVPDAPVPDAPVPDAPVPDAPVPSTGNNSGMQESLDSWDDVRAFILSEFSGSIQNDHGESLTIIKYWDDGRGQMVIIGSMESQSGVPWIGIKSPVGILPVQILPRICETLNDKVCGGLIKLGDRYWIRHSMPIGDTSHDELLFPLNVVAVVADTLEETFVGGDEQ